MAKPARFRAYSLQGHPVANGPVKQKVARVSPEGDDAVLVVFYSGKRNEECVAGSAEVRIPVGMTSEVIFSD